MSLLTEQEINDAFEKYFNPDDKGNHFYTWREACEFAEAKVIEKIKEQGPGGYYYQDTDTAISHNQYLQLISEHEGNSEALRELGTLLKLYRLPEGD